MSYSGLVTFSDISGVETVAGKGAEGARFMASMQGGLDCCASAHRASPAVDGSMPGKPKGSIGRA